MWRAPPAPAAGAAVNTHAQSLLRRLGIEVQRIVRVCSDESPEAILYVTGANRARTVWITYKDGKLRSRDEAGFPIEPSHSL